MSSLNYDVGGKDPNDSASNNELYIFCRDGKGISFATALSRARRKWGDMATLESISVTSEIFYGPNPREPDYDLYVVVKLLA